MFAGSLEEELHQDLFLVLRQLQYFLQANGASFVFVAERAGLGPVVVDEGGQIAAVRGGFPQHSLEVHHHRQGSDLQQNHNDEPFVGVQVHEVKKSASKAYWANHLGKQQETMDTPMKPLASMHMVVVGVNLKQRIQEQEAESIGMLQQCTLE